MSLLEAVKDKAADVKESFPEKYGSKAYLGNWDVGVATLIIPATITALDSLSHDVVGVEIPHGINTFFGTVGGCLLAFWFARKFRPQKKED